jgi:hypothetical protein
MKPTSFTPCRFPPPDLRRFVTAWFLPDSKLHSWHKRATNAAECPAVAVPPHPLPCRSALETITFDRKDGVCTSSATSL